MGCLFVILSLITPRLIIVVLWIFTNYLSTAFGGWLWPTLGFFLMPTTTIAYAIAQHAFNGIRGGGVIILVIGVLIDLGIVGGGARSRR